MKKSTIEEMQKIAKSRGGKCLSKRYRSAHTPLTWQCENGHVWKAVPYSIKNGHWCWKCGVARRASAQRLTIKEMQKLAESRGGKYLSKKYVNVETKQEWMCSAGHKWKATPHDIRDGTWCPKCSYVERGVALKSTLKDMQEIARSRKGECLSNTYVNSITKLKWRCEKGHIWMANPSSVKFGGWCPVCAGKQKLTIEEMQKIAKERGGTCLSRRCQCNKFPLKWQCKERHVWRAIANSVKRGSWCPICAGIQKLTIGEMKHIARERGGACLSKIYYNSSAPLKWRCKEGHVWKASPANVKKGVWCPECSQGVSERICRRYFEAIFGKKFPKTRPKWLIGSKKHKLELDGYCTDLKIAFEYQGVQHYGRVGFFQTKRMFEQRRKEDAIKKKICKRRGVTLIQVPYIIEPEDMGNYIIEICKKNGMKISRLTSPLDYKRFNIYSPEKLKEMSEIARGRGGVCLSKKYIDSKTKLKWKCKNDHVWTATPAHIKSGKWCPRCFDDRRGTTRKLTIDEMRNIAEARGGRCLSKKYINSNTKLKWRCKRGHVWSAIPCHVKSGSWCPTCANEKIGTALRSTIVEMQKIAVERGGKCISKKYADSQTHIAWQCKERHIWKAAPSDVKSGSWCPKCAVTKRAAARRATIEEMQKIAKQKGGMCLSKEYKNSNTHLLWRCKEGHVWKAVPSSVKSGSWCPKCYHIDVGLSQRLTIEDVQKMAEKRGGKCRSIEYTNTQTKLLWQCKKGHMWEAIPNSIQQGRWCPRCARKKAKV